MGQSYYLDLLVVLSNSFVLGCLSQVSSVRSLAKHYPYILNAEDFQWLLVHRAMIKPRILYRGKMTGSKESRTGAENLSL